MRKIGVLWLGVWFAITLLASPALAAMQGHLLAEGQLTGTYGH